MAKWCAKCSDRPPEVGKIWCGFCIALAEKYEPETVIDAKPPKTAMALARVERGMVRQMEIYNKNKNDGLCVDCGLVKVKDMFRCRPCGDIRNTHSRRRYLENLAKGKKRIYTKAQKARDAELRDKKRADAKAIGMCVKCKLNPASDGNITCEPCLISGREDYHVMKSTMNDDEYRLARNKRQRDNYNLKHNT